MTIVLVGARRDGERRVLGRTVNDALTSLLTLSSRPRVGGRARGRR